MESPSTVKSPSNHRHDGFTVTPSPALYVKAGSVTVARIGGKATALLTLAQHLTLWAWRRVIPKWFWKKRQREHRLPNSIYGVALLWLRTNDSSLTNRFSKSVISASFSFIAFSNFSFSPLIAASSTPSNSKVVMLLSSRPG